jgi:predicted secreted hydrolase
VKPSRLGFFGTAICWVLTAFCLPVPTLADETTLWKQAIAPRIWQFPLDNGVHQEYRTEWWYFTGNLADGKGNRYGYELTFFREGMRRDRPDPNDVGPPKTSYPTHSDRRDPSDVGPPKTSHPAHSDRRDPSDVWSVRDIYLAHFAVTDVSGRRFTADDRVSRTGPGIAGSAADRLLVWLRDWSAKEEAGGRMLLRAKGRGTELSIELTPLKPPVVHGQGGVSRKGDLPGQASYYASYSNLGTRGSLRTPGGTGAVEVTGVSWFDHEFGSGQLALGQAGWDWFSLHMSDGRELMIYALRRTDGSVEPASSGTIVNRSGSHKHLTLTQIKVEVLDRWRSSKSGAAYPSRWRIRVPSEGLDLAVRPVLPDQELLTPETTGVTYWEGAVEGTGLSANRPVTCRGYIELTGYAGTLGGLF